MYDFIIRQYGTITAKLRPIEESYVCSMNNAVLMDEEVETKMVDTIGNRNNDSLYWLNTEKTMNGIKNTIYELFHATIDEVEVRNNRGSMVVKSFTINIPETELVKISKMEYQQNE